MQNCTQLTPAQYAIYEQDFKLHDSEGKGLLRQSDVRDLFGTHIGRVPTQREMDDFFSTAKTEQNGRLSLNNYITWVLGESEWSVATENPITVPVWNDKNMQAPTTLVSREP